MKWIVTTDRLLYAADAMTETSVDPNYTRALTEIFRDEDPSESVATRIFALRGETKRMLAPLAKGIRVGHKPVHVLQRCLELPHDAPLHRAAADLLARGVVAGPVHVSVAPVPRKKCPVWSLLRSQVAPVFYVAEEKGRVSVWSIETGEHVEDLAFPKSSARPRAFAELADGTLRVVTDGKEVLARAPGAPGFTTVLKFKAAGSSQRVDYWAGSDDLGLHLVKPEFHPVEGPTGSQFELAVYDVAAKKPRTVFLAARYLGDFVHVTSTVIGVAYYRDEGDERVYELALIDLATASVRVLPLPGEAETLHTVDEGRALIFVCRFPDGDKQWVRFALGDGSHVVLSGDAINPKRFMPHELVPLYDGYQDGLLYEDDRHAVINPAREVLAYYAAGPRTMSAHIYPQRVLLAGPRPGWFILATAELEESVALIAPYSASVAARQRPAEPLPKVPDWARRGVILDYSVSDYDAADRYRMRVVTADDGLTLKIEMLNGEEDEDSESSTVASAARFTAAALEQATELVVLSQGGADAELDEEISDRAPPCMIGRALFARLNTGAAEPFPHVWLGDEPMTLESSGEVEPRTVIIDGADQRVPVRAFSGDAGTLSVLDDLRWPLIIEYDSGDCHIRLTGMTLPRAAKKVPRDQT